MLPEGSPPPTEPQQRAVMRAYKRGLGGGDYADFPICPTRVGAAAQMALIRALHRGGWIKGESAPVLTDKAKAWASVRLRNEAEGRS